MPLVSSVYALASKPWKLPSAAGHSKPPKPQPIPKSPEISYDIQNAIQDAACVLSALEKITQGTSTGRFQDALNAARRLRQSLDFAVDGDEGVVVMIDRGKLRYRCEFCNESMTVKCKRFCSLKCGYAGRAEEIPAILSSEEQLRRLHFELKLSYGEIATRLKVHPVTVWKAMKRFGIKGIAGKRPHTKCADCGKPVCLYKSWDGKSRSRYCAFHHRIHKAEYAKLWMQEKRKTMKVAP